MPSLKLILLVLGRGAAVDVVRGKIQIVSSAGIAQRAPIQIEIAESEAWGDGTHPSTALCLEYLSEREWKDDDIFLDMGCGSAVLSIAARRLGCPHCVAVDIDDEILEDAAANALRNNVHDIQFMHARSVVPGDGPVATVAVANILVGALTRPSMITTLAMAIRQSEGELCLSGFRPGDDTEIITRLYSKYFDFFEYLDRAPDASGKHYWGEWARLVGRRRGGEDKRDNPTSSKSRPRQDSLLLDALSDSALG